MGDSKKKKSDFIILRKKKEANLEEHYPEFSFLLPYLGEVIVVEYKSPLDRLTLDDFFSSNYLNY